VKYLVSCLFFFVLSCAHNPTTRLEISKFTKLPLSSQLRPFVSDGCSKWPNGTRDKPDAWLKCCFKHDIAYWLGGTEAQREVSDDNLKMCVEKNFSNAVALLMYLGVRVGGEPTFKTSYKWGFGWTYDRGYLAISKAEYEFSKGISPKANEPMEKYLSLP